MHCRRIFSSLPNPDQGRIRTHIARLRSLPAEFYERSAVRGLPAEYFTSKTPEFRAAIEFGGLPEAETIPEVLQLPSPEEIMA